MNVSRWVDLVLSPRYIVPSRGVLVNISNQMFKYVSKNQINFIELVEESDCNRTGLRAGRFGDSSRVRFLLIRLGLWRVAGPGVSGGGRWPGC